MDRPGGTAGIGLDVGPGVRPHSGADLSTGTRGLRHPHLSVARIAVGGRLGIRVEDPARSRRRCTGVGAAGHRGRRSTAGFSGCSGPAHRQRLHAVTRLVGVCEPDGIIANRLDSWHGAGFHPYSFTHLDVLTAPAVDDGLAEEADRFLVAVTFQIGRLRIPVVAEFTSPEPRTIVVRIVDGEGTGSVVETHATPVDPGADRRPRTAVLEAVIAHSDRTGFVQARKAGAPTCSCGCCPATSAGT